MLSYQTVLFPSDFPLLQSLTVEDFNSKSLIGGPDMPDLPRLKSLNFWLVMGNPKQASVFMSKWTNLRRFATLAGFRNRAEQVEPEPGQVGRLPYTHYHYAPFQVK